MLWTIEIVDWIEIFGALRSEQVASPLVTGASKEKESFKRKHMALVHSS